MTALVDQLLRKFGHAQGVLKRTLIHMAELEIVLLDLENPGYGDVAHISLITQITSPPHHCQPQANMKGIKVSQLASQGSVPS